MGFSCARTWVALLVRALETWTHADDIRRAVGAGMVTPPPASLLTMAWAWRAGSCRPCSPPGDSATPGRLIRFRFTDLAGAAWDIDLGTVDGVRPAGTEAVDTEIVAAAAKVCRCISARIDPRDLPYDVVGDVQLARDVVAALPVLGVL